MVSNNPRGPAPPGAAQPGAVWHFQRLAANKVPLTAPIYLAGAARVLMRWQGDAVTRWALPGGGEGLQPAPERATGAPTPVRLCTPAGVHTNHPAHLQRACGGMQHTPAPHTCAQTPSHAPVRTWVCVHGYARVCSSARASVCEHPGMNVPIAGSFLVGTKSCKTFPCVVWHRVLQRRGCALFLALRRGCYNSQRDWKCF